MGNACARTRLPFLATLLLVLACQDDRDGSPPASAGEDATASATSGTATGPTSAADACALLPPGEVEPIVGQPVTDSLALAMPSDGAPTTLSQCNYAAGDNAALVSLMLRRGTEGQTAQAASDRVRESLESSGMELQDVSGLGGAALWGSNQLHVFGDAGWYIIVTPDPSAGLEQARALTERAVSRLEAGG